MVPRRAWQTRRARVIYYFHSEHIPLFALDVYAKNERADLKPDEINQLKRVVKLIADAYMRKGKRT